MGVPLLPPHGLLDVSDTITRALIEQAVLRAAERDEAARLFWSPGSSVSLPPEPFEVERCPHR